MWPGGRLALRTAESSRFPAVPSRREINMDGTGAFRRTDRPRAIEGPLDLPPEGAGTEAAGLAPASRRFAPRVGQRSPISVQMR